ARHAPEEKSGRDARAQGEDKFVTPALLPVSFEPVLGVEGRLAARTSRGDGLTIMVVLDVSAREDAINGGRHGERRHPAEQLEDAAVELATLRRQGAAGEQIARRVGLELSPEELDIRIVADGQEHRVR